jgi:Arc/MetJ-type ribon-helix-helix transcriptional regulator
MTPKQNVLRFVATLPDDVNYERILYHVGVMHAVEVADAQVARGEYEDHDEFFDRLLRTDEKSKNHLGASSNERRGSNSGVPRPQGSKNGRSVRKKTQSMRRKTKKLP